MTMTFEGMSVVGGSVFWLPFRLLWWLVKAAAIPAIVVALFWWLASERAAIIATGIAGLYLIGLGTYMWHRQRARFWMGDW